MLSSRFLRVLTGVILLIHSVGILLSWYTGQIFPWIHLATFISVLLVLGTQPFNLGSRAHLHWSVLTLCIVGVLYRVPLTLLPDTLPGKDPEKYSLFARFTMLSGNYTIPELPFYGQAGGFHTYIAETAMISGITAEQAMTSVGSALGLWAPLMAAGVAFLMFDSDSRYEAGTVAAIVAVALSLSVRLSLIPIAQSVGTLLFVTYLYIVTKQMRASRQSSLKLSYVIAALALLLAMMLSHKIPVLIASGIVTVMWLGTKISSSTRFWPWVPTNQSLSFGYVVLTSAVVGVQQNITGYLADGLERAQNTFLNAAELPIRSGQDPMAASVPDVGVLWVFESHSHAPVLLFAGLLAWVAIGWFLLVRNERPRSETVALLVAIASLTMLVVGGLAGSVLPEGIHPLRFQVLVEVPLAGLVGAGFVVVRKRLPALTWSPSRQSLRRVMFAGLVVILVFHTFTSVAAPDYPGSQRSYLTDSEMSAKEFSTDNVPGEIYTDYLLSVRTPEPQTITDKTNRWAQLGGRPFGIRYVSMNAQLLNGTAVSAGHPTMIYRTQETVYEEAEGFKNFKYRVEWDIERAADNQYHRIYDSGGAVIYRNPAL